MQICSTKIVNVPSDKSELSTLSDRMPPCNARPTKPRHRLAKLRAHADRAQSNNYRRISTNEWQTNKTIT